MEQKFMEYFRKPKPHCKLLLHFSHWRYCHNKGGPKPPVRDSQWSPVSKGDWHRLHHKLTLLSLSFFAMSSSSSLALTRSFSSSAADIIVTAKTARLLQGYNVSALTPG